MQSPVLSNTELKIKKANKLTRVLTLLSLVTVSLRSHRGEVLGHYHSETNTLVHGSLVAEYLD